jgi:integrase
MHKLWKHPNGTFYALHGPRLRSRASLRTKDRGEADTLFAQFVAANTHIAPESPTLGEIFQGYKASRSSKVRAPASLKFAVQALEPHVGKLRPENVTPKVFEDYAEKRQKEGVSAGTILREVGVARAALSWSVAHKWLDQRLKPVIPNPVPTPKGRERWLTRDEAKRLLAACRAAHLRLFVMLGIMTGARSGAILELKWKTAPDQAPPYVDMERRLIDYGTGHGNKRRAIAPINDELLAVLKAARELSCSDFVIEHNAKPIRHIKNSFEAACGRAEVAGVTPHILRHTCCTWLVEAGVSYEEIGKLVGDDAKTIEKIYGHHSPEFLKRATTALQLSQTAK